jgi:hypothetical protein
MIKDIEIHAFTIICDECGADYCEDSAYCGYPTPEDAILFAEEECWLHIKKDGRHICPTCWHKVYVEQFQEVE